MKTNCTCEDCTNPNDDPLRGARGIVWATFASLALWGVLGVVWKLW